MKPKASQSNQPLTRRQDKRQWLMRDLCKSAYRYFCLGPATEDLSPCLPIGLLKMTRSYVSRSDMFSMCSSLISPGSSINKWSVLEIRRTFIHYGVPAEEVFDQLKAFFERTTGVVDKGCIEREFDRGVRRLDRPGSVVELQAPAETYSDVGAPAIAGALDTKPEQEPAPPTPSLTLTFPKTSSTLALPDDGVSGTLETTGLSSEESITHGSKNNENAQEETYVMEIEGGKYYCTISDTRYNPAGELTARAWLPTEIPLSSLRQVDRVATDHARRNRRTERRANMNQ